MKRMRLLIDEWAERINWFWMLWALVLIIAVASPKPSKPADLGRLARYDDDSPATIANNDSAIKALQDALPMDGGSLDLREGTLHIGRKIKNPVRWQNTGAKEWRPLNWSIDGKINSTIVFHDPDPTDADVTAIEYAPNTPTITYDGKFASQQTVRLGLRNFHLIGGSIHLQGGGKYVQARNVIVSSVKGDGFWVKDFDGGFLDNITARLCARGMYFENCHQVSLRTLRPRENTGDGWVTVNCGALTGDVNPEGNGGLQMSHDQLQQSNLHLWVESGQSNSKPQAKMTRCEYNVIGGVDQGGGYDFDEISKATTRFANDPSQWPPVGVPVGAATKFEPFAGKPLLANDGLAIVCLPGCMAQTVMPYGEIQGIDPTAMLEYKAGDYVQVSLDVVCDADTQAWCGDRQILLFQFAGGTFPEARQNVRITGERTKVNRMLGAAPADGKGLRLFVMILGTGPTAPAQPKQLRFGLENVSVRYLKN